MQDVLLQSWADATTSSLFQVWGEFMAFVPKLIGLGLVFAIGVMLASFLGNLVQRFLEKIRIDSILSGTGVDKEFERSGVKISLSRFFGRLTYWLLFIATVVLVTNNLFGEGTVAGILQPILDFIPKVAVSVIILVGSLILANFLKGVVHATLVGTKMHAPKFLSAVSWWAVAIFGGLAALEQLGVGGFITGIAQTVIMGAVLGVSLAFGIAFGLGGKDAAQDWLSRMKHH